MTVSEVLSRKPYLRLITSDVFNISKRIKKIEKEYFIVWNVLREKWEVHSTANIGDSYCFTVPYDGLDERTLRYCHMTRNAAHGNQYKAMKEHNALIKEKNDKEFENYMRDVTCDTRKDISLAIDRDTLHEGYRRSVMI